MAGGDTLIVGNGTYDEIITDLTGTTSYVVRPPSGSSWSSPTTIKAENPLGATIVVTSPPGGWGSIMEFDSNSSYIVFEGFVLDGQFARDPLVGMDVAAHHLRFKDMELKNSAGSGFQGEASNWEFINLHIHHSGWTATNNTSCTQGNCPTTCGQSSNFCLQVGSIYSWAKCHGFCHGFYIKGSGHLIDGGYFHDNDDQAVQLYAGNSTVRNATMSYNPNWGVGSFGSSNTIYNNVFNHCGNNTLDGSGGFAASGAIILSGGTNTVVGNTIYNSGGTNGVYGVYDRNHNSTIKNNLFVNLPVTAERGYIYGEGGGGASGNWYVTNGVNASLIAGNICDNNTMVGCTAVSASSTFFVNPGAVDFHNASGAPQLNAGVTLGTLYDVDHDGGARPQGTGWDVGAYEGTGTVQPPPPTRLPAPTNLRVRVQ